MIVISAGMPKAGTAWFYRISNDVLVAAGCEDSEGIREKYRMQPILKNANNLMRGSGLALSRLLIPNFHGHSFVVKTHEGPRAIFRLWQALGIARITYIYRDPRDVALSAFEHGLRLRAAGRTEGTFADLHTLEEAIMAARMWVNIWERWVACKQVQIVRYEDLLADPYGQVKRLASHLSLNIQDEVLKEIPTRYDAQKKAEALKSMENHMHFNRGVIGRYREVMSPSQLKLCTEVLGPFLVKMGYEQG